MGVIRFSFTGSAKASVMEISHRGADFMALAQKSEQDLRDLMNIHVQFGFDHICSF
jgi:phosphoserine aminotransferase